MRTWISKIERPEDERAGGVEDLAAALKKEKAGAEGLGAGLLFAAALGGAGAGEAANEPNDGRAKGAEGLVGSEGLVGAAALLATTLLGAEGEGEGPFDTPKDGKEKGAADIVGSTGLAEAAAFTGVGAGPPSEGRSKLGKVKGSSKGRETSVRISSPCFNDNYGHRKSVVASFAKRKKEKHKQH